MHTASRLPVLALVGSSIIWGCTWIPLKYFASAGLDGAALFFIAYGSVLLFALPLLWRQLSQWRTQWRFITGIFCLGGYASIAFNMSVMYGDVVRMMSLFYMLPVWAVVGGLLFLGERLTLLRLLAVACALTGAWLILGGVNIFAQPPSWLDLLAISSGFAYAMNNIIFRATPHLPIPPKVALMFFSCTAISALLLLLGVQHWPVNVSPSLLLLAGGFGLCWLLLANIGTQWGVTHLEAGRAAVIIILELVAAVITSMWLNHEVLSLTEWCGAGLILTAAVLEARG
ncbi:MAG TPA: DMT family transporter [Pseudomonadales bacterium]|nr:DMT family transporter [Pseudomonadales bacterium]